MNTDARQRRGCRLVKPLVLAMEHGLSPYWVREVVHTFGVPRRWIRGSLVDRLAFSRAVAKLGLYESAKPVICSVQELQMRNGPGRHPSRPRKSSAEAMLIAAPGFALRTASSEDTAGHES